MKPAQIVLIEDSPGDVLLVKLALQENGIPFALTHYECGSDAARSLGDNGTCNELVPDLIVLDLNTPRSDGFEVLRQLTTTPRISHVPILILTSSRARADKSRVVLYGARYVEKPYQLDDFLSTVGRTVKSILSTAS